MKLSKGTVAYQIISLKLNKATVYFKNKFIFTTTAAILKYLRSTFAPCCISTSFLIPGHLKIDSSLKGEAHLENDCKSTWFNTIHELESLLPVKPIYFNISSSIRICSHPSVHVIPWTEMLSFYALLSPLPLAPSFSLLSSVLLSTCLSAHKHASQPTDTVLGAGSMYLTKTSSSVTRNLNGQID